MASRWYKQFWPLVVLPCLSLLVLSGCNEPPLQARVIWKWQAVGVSYNGSVVPVPMDQMNINGTTVPVPTGAFGLTIQFFEQNVVEVVFTDHTAAPSGTSAELYGRGTYTFSDATTIEITMPAGTQGFQALNTFVPMVLAQKGVGRAAFATVHPASLLGGPDATAVAPNGISPTLTTGIMSNRYQMHLAGKQLTMTDKYDVTLIYEKWAYSI